MFCSLALTAMLALTPGQAGKLQIANVRNTYGQLGPTRADSKFIPGDVMIVSFDVVGITIGDDGRVHYSSQLEVFDKDGKSLYKQDPIEKFDFAPVGGNRIPCLAFVTVGVDQAPGTYSAKIKIEDKATKAVETIERKFEVTPPAFGIVMVYASCDDAGKIPTPSVGVVGQSAFVFFSAIGFQRDDKKQPYMKFEMAVIDETGKPTLQKPLVHEVKSADERVVTYPLRYAVPMTRPGKFKLRITCEDKLAKKTVTFEHPITVLNPET